MGPILLSGISLTVSPCFCYSSVAVKFDGSLSHMQILPIDRFCP